MSASVPRIITDKTSTPNVLQTPTGQYFGAQFESPSRYGAHGRTHVRRSSAANSIASIGGLSDAPTLGKEDSIAELGNNAISTLLRPPIVRTGLQPYTTIPPSHKAPSTRDIPPVTLTNIPHVDSSVFRPYLKQAGSLYEAFRRTKEGQEVKGQPKARKPSRDDTKDYFGNALQRRPSTVPQTPSTPRFEPGSPSLASPSETLQPRRRSSGGVSRRAPPAAAPLSTIPHVYFDEDFHLENPRTFDVVSERSEIARPSSGVKGSGTPGTPTGKKAIATNAILQEKLSWYMDTVEIHLISSISQASSSFFAALGSLRELHSEAAESAAKIKSLRSDIAKLDQGMAKGGLEIVAMRRRRDNVRKLTSAVQQLQRVVEAIVRCEEQVDSGDIEDALNGLGAIRNLIEGRPDPTALGSQSSRSTERLVNLRGVKALEEANNDIAILRRRIGKAFEARFIESLLKDIRQHVDTVPSTHTFQRWDKASNRRHGQTPSIYPAYLSVADGFRATLLAALKGLARSDVVVPATTAYRDVILREIKSLIRRHLPSSNDDDVESTTSISTEASKHLSPQEKSSILARNLRALDTEDAEEMLKKIYSNVGEALRRLGTQVKVLLDVTSTLADPQSDVSPVSPLKSPRITSPDGRPRADPMAKSLSATLRHDEIQQSLDLSSLLGQAVDIAQNQIIKILKVRSEQTTRLDILPFLRYFTLNRLFADECEAVSGRGGNALKTLVNNHIREFVPRFGEQERQRLVTRMDADLWEARDFTDQDAARLNRILESSTKEIDEWNQDTQIWVDQSPTKEPAPVTNGIHQASTSLQPPSSIQANGNSPSLAPSTSPAPNPAEAPKLRTAQIESQTFILPISAHACLSGIEGHLHLLHGIPSLTADISVLLLDYLKLYNSRTSQLILGAGATRSAGLKNITTRHLALSSQALSLIITVIPYIREFVRRRPGSSNGNLMAEFDKVKRLLQEHQQSIFDKLIDMMSGRVATHVGTMKKIAWDDEATDKGGAVNMYMQTLVKETSTLAKVMAKHLPEGEVRGIMMPVLGAYRDQLGEGFKGLEVRTGKGKDCLLRDAEFFATRISKIENETGATGGRESLALGPFILGILRDKKVTSVEKTNEKKDAGPPSPAPQRSNSQLVEKKEKDGAATSNGTGDQSSGDRNGTTEENGEGAKSDATNGVEKAS
ncbi:hypothetical protein MMC25_007715 [Agyrium rufum]|nr:hypothetical protein [Agyrium rufum]